MEDSLIGEKLSKYKLLEEIGRGGMGVVYKGYDPVLDRCVAIKVLAPHLAWEKEFVERFMREARAAARLRHPAIITIHDVGEEDGRYYFVMEHLEGQTLVQYLRQQGRLPPEEVLGLLWPLADALDHAHQSGLLHRDIKPANIVITGSGQVVLTDFGIARIAQEGQITSADLVAGTPQYMSPEQAEGSEIDGRSDQYSLAVMAYEMLGGRPPFQADSALSLLHKVVYEPPPSILRVRPDLPQEVEQVMARALAKRPDDRYPTASIFVAELAQALTGEVAEGGGPELFPGPPAVEPLPDSAQEPAPLQPRPTRRRLPVWAWIVGGLALGSVAVGVILALVLLPLPQPDSNSILFPATETPAMLPSATLRPADPTGAWFPYHLHYQAESGEGPQVLHILFDPSDFDIVYAATNQGIYRSGDGGESWELRSVGLGDDGERVITSLAVDPANPQTIFAGTWGYGILRSTDGGLRWSRLTDPLGSDLLAPGSLERQEHPLILAGGFSFSYVGEEASEVSPAAWQRTAVRCLAVNPANSGDIVACIDDGYGLYQSADGGASWSRLAVGAGSPLAYVFASDRVRYASFGSWHERGGFYRSSDGGETWSEIGAAVFERAVIAAAVHPADPDVVLVGTAGDGLYRTIDGGRSWARVSGNLGNEVFYSIAFAPSAPDVVYAGGSEGLYGSSNGGSTWEDVGGGFSGTFIRGLAVHPADPAIVLAGASDFPRGGIYRRAGEGMSFALEIEGMAEVMVLDLAVDPLTSSIIYAGTWGGGLLYSVDGGLTWQRGEGTTPYIHAVETARTESGTVVYAAAFYRDGGLYRSQDQGESWVAVGQGELGVVMMDVEVVDREPGHLVAATSRGVRYSEDGGETWQDVRGLEQGIVLGLCEFPATGHLLAVVYGRGVFYSREGRAWYEANEGISPAPGSQDIYAYDVACSPETPGLAYQASWGIYTSNDYGEHWELSSNGLPEDYFQTLEVVPGTGQVIAGSHQSGVYLAPKTAPRWEAIGGGLTERHVRTIAVTSHHPPRVVISAGEGGVWEYRLADRAPATRLYLPVILAAPLVFQEQAAEPNNSFWQARSISLPDTVHSSIASGTDEDYYRFDIRSLEPITVELAWVSAGLDDDLELYDGATNRVGGSYRSAGGGERIVFYPVQAGRYYVRVFPGAANSRDHAYQLSLSQAARLREGQISGVVTDQGRGLANVPIVLYHDRGYRVERLTTVSDLMGEYRFRGLPSLPLGHTYSIVYPNNEDDDGRLAWWACQPISDYHAGDELAGCSFDVAGVAVESPAHESVLGLPAVFSWTPRDAAGERYGVRLRSADGTVYWESESRVGASSVTLSDLPNGFDLDQPYRWDLFVCDGAGCGVSYYYRLLTFSVADEEIKGEGPGIPNDLRRERGLLPLFFPR
ncbi:MAG: protein kinase [Anaerolineae bacterium]|nr:protein kinase [Anaerolineae bacterium]